jgi:hypothetical protein
MKSKSSVFFWGVLFISIGLLVLLYNLNVVSDNFEFILDWWPVILIIWGINLLKIPQMAKNILSALSAVIIALIIFSLYFNCMGNCCFDSDDNCSASNHYNNNTNKVFIERDSSISETTLNINCGAYHLNISDTTSKLAEADIAGNDDEVKLQRDSDNVINLDFKSNMKHIFKSHNHHRNAKISLNSDIVWNINLDMGASSVNCDLERYKTKNITINGGASDIKLKLGRNMIDSSLITLSVGASSIHIQIPNEVGCRINSSTGLSNNDFQGFSKSDDGDYYSQNYSSASKKIFIDISGGVSNFKVKRY